MTAGENRWLPAKPPAPWSDEYPALIYGANCPQNLHSWTAIEQTFIQDWDDGWQSEDMLKLNIWTPSLSGKRPVMGEIAGRLAEQGWDVVAVAVDVGQPGDLHEAVARADQLGAVESRLVDARTEYAENYVLPALRMNALYQGRYPLVSALSRPLISKVLVDIADYRALMKQTTVGCRFRCDFCDIIQFNGGFTRPKTLESIREDLEIMYKLGHRGGIFTVDDNFVGNPQAIEVILEEMIAFQREHGYPFSFYTQASLDLGSPKLHHLVPLMKQAGFNEVFLGIENPDGAVGNRLADADPIICIGNPRAGGPNRGLGGSVVVQDAALRGDGPDGQDPGVPTRIRR